MNWDQVRDYIGAMTPAERAGPALVYVDDDRRRIVTGMHAHQGRAVLFTAETETLRPPKEDV